ncbi:glycosyltransferase family 9 protein [Motiliproteus sediminis]|uniref:glycosyltransferase family 9 protein n=1 Tax=Motiliproteus sediminis TaxID=1468178 RepID=UPI001AF027D2|nr:glycosyltransferase family 9 protein [Motiliproteus sediminis]
MLSADLLRRLDRWLGLPLVWMFGLLRLLLRYWYPAAANRQGPLLVIQLSEMGSVIIAEPALREIGHHQGPFHFLTLERNADCLALLPALPLERVFVLRDRSLWLLAWDSLRFIRWSRQQRLGAVLDLELFSRFSTLLGLFSGASRRIGFGHAGEGLSQGGLVTEPVAYNSHRHMRDNYLALARQLLGQDVAGCSPTAKDVLNQVTPFPYDGAAERSVGQRVAWLFNPSPRKPRRRILVQVGAEGVLPQRNWPRAHWVSAIGGLVSEEGAEVVLCGRQQEWAAAELIRQQVDSPLCVNACGLFAVAELPHLYRNADLLLAADSGPAHFAAVAQLPVLVLFGPETPALFRPLGEHRVLYAGLACSPCVSAANHRCTQCRDNRCMQQILPAEVVASARQMLADNAVVRLASRRA